MARLRWFLTIRCPKRRRISFFTLNLFLYFRYLPIISQREGILIHICLSIRLKERENSYTMGKHIVIVPTVAATDAPCTGLSVIYNDDHSFDKYLFYPTNPDAVMVDCNVIANAPVHFLVSGMGDALGTYFEGRASIRTESSSLEGTGITRAGQALAKLCYNSICNCYMRSVQYINGTYHGNDEIDKLSKS